MRCRRLQASGTSEACYRFNNVHDVVIEWRSMETGFVFLIAAALLST
jgi:hypothetical protein